MGDSTILLSFNLFAGSSICSTKLFHIVSESIFVQSILLREDGNGDEEEEGDEDEEEEEEEEEDEEGDEEGNEDET